MLSFILGFTAIAFLILSIILSESDEKYGSLLPLFPFGVSAYLFNSYVMSFADIAILAGLGSYSLVAVLPWFFVGYVIVGSLYVVIWRFKAHIKDSAEAIQSCFKTWLHTNKKDENDRYQHVDEFVSSDFYSGLYGASANKSRIFGWVIWWPFSMLYHLSHRPIRYATTKAYDLIKTQVDKIGKNTSKNMLK